ncbi:unnamed protein product [Choristocarpus tenellus]
MGGWRRQGGTEFVDEEFGRRRSSGKVTGPGDVSEATEEEKLCILDARTAVAALGNKLKGYGVETGSRYRSVQLVFADIGNVSAVRESFEGLRGFLDPAVGSGQLKGGSVGELMTRGLGIKAMDLKQALGFEMHEGGSSAAWSGLIRQVLAASVLAARCLRLEGGCSVLVHCSDGWDRTPQMCSTVQILLDPYYRTVEGLCVLIEKEWVSFGHQFRHRCGGGRHYRSHSVEQGQGTGQGALQGAGSLSSKTGGQVMSYEGLTPIFLQFLEVLHNVMKQFPLTFQYTEELLGFLAEHTYSDLFGTFLCDTERQRHELRLPQRTCSVWATILDNKADFANPDYQPTDEALWPSLAACKIQLWEQQHCRDPGMHPHQLSGKVWEDRVGMTLNLLRRSKERAVAGGS